MCAAVVSSVGAAAHHQILRENGRDSVGHSLGVRDVLPEAFNDLLNHNAHHDTICKDGGHGRGLRRCLSDLKCTQQKDQDEIAQEVQCAPNFS